MTRRRTIPRARRGLYRAARTLGDVDAAAHGPAALGKRIVRKRVYRGWLGLLNRMLR